jgi:hypothetical protein
MDIKHYSFPEERTLWQGNKISRNMFFNVLLWEEQEQLMRENAETNT